MQLPEVLLENCHERGFLAELSSNERFDLAVFGLIDYAEEALLADFNFHTLNILIAKIDQQLGLQIHEILQSPAFKSLESSWRGIYLLWQNLKNQATNIQLEVISISKEDLHQNFERAPSLSSTLLYRELYENEFDMPGGEPFAAMISDYFFLNTTEDLRLLKNLGRVCQLCLCPFIGNVSPDFFGKTSWDELSNLPDLNTWLHQPDFYAWQNFRQCDEARFIGLTLPQYLARLPYGLEKTIKTFPFLESNYFTQRTDFCWTAASFAFASVLIRSFESAGWLLNIRGLEHGRVSSLPRFYQPVAAMNCYDIPTEFMISEHLELTFSELGFIPFCYFKNSDYACFFSASSVQAVTGLPAHPSSATARINARLPYVFLCARIAHYLKVLQRETIGTHEDKISLQEKLNLWLQTLTTKMPHPDPEIIAQHPLREASVTVHDNPLSPGMYQVDLKILPHFQLEGIDIYLSLVAQFPVKNISSHTRSY